MMYRCDCRMSGKVKVYRGWGVCGEIIRLRNENEENTCRLKALSENVK